MSGKLSSVSVLDEQGVCLLSLDGGGVRGLSSLHVLKRIMDGHNAERRKNGKNPQKPSEVFDLIGGTSTGGLIAIMLGRLGMDVDECIDSYNNLIKIIFSDKSRVHQSKFSLRGQTQARFDSKALESAINKTIRERGLSPTDKMLEATEPSCKVFVCATSKSSVTTHRFRSYETHKTSIDATICQAARATSAATTFFDPVPIEDMYFVDGAFGANNPVEQVEDEATEIWCSETGNIKPLVKCFISIGTGNMGTYDINDRVDKFVATLGKMYTDAERTAEASMSRWRQHYDQGRYFRFNVENGLKSVGMKEYRKKGEIQGATYRYLDGQAQSLRLRKCIENLALKQGPAASNIEELIQGYGQMPSFNPPPTPDSVKGHPDQPCPESPRGQQKSRLSCLSPPAKLSPSFLGRQDYIEKLYRTFSKDCHQRAALVGLAGVGKTQIALYFEDCVRLYYPDYTVLWISASSVDDSYVRIAQELNLLETYDHEHKELNAKMIVHRYLEKEEKRRWFLIIDGVVNYVRLPDLPRSERGRVLFLTRCMKVATAAVGDEVDQIIKVDGLDIPTALSLFESLLISKGLLKDTEKTERLLSELSNIPLAITHAASDEHALAFITKEYAEFDLRLGCRTSMYNTFLQSFEDLRDISQDAVATLESASRFDPQHIPRTLLSISDTKDTLEDSIGILCSSFLLSPNLEDQSYDMPTVVYLSMRAWAQQNNSRKRIIKQAVRRLNKLIPDDNSANHPLWKKLQKHTIRVLQDCEAQGMQLNERFELSAKIGLRFMRQRYLRSAIIWLEQAWHWLKQSQSKSSHMIYIQIRLAEAYAETGLAHKAIRLAEKAITMQEKYFSKDDSMIVAVSCALSKGCRFNNDPGKGIERLERMRKTNGKRSPETKFALLAELGKCYSYNKSYDKAIQAFKISIAATSRKVGKDDPALLNVKNHLAHAYSQAGLTKDSITLMEETLPIQQNVLGRKHPETLHLQVCLAESYTKTGDKEKAASQWEELITIQRATLGKTHEKTMRSENNLATAYYDSKKTTKALKLLEHMAAEYMFNVTNQAALAALTTRPTERSELEQLVKKCKEDLAEFKAKLLQLGGAGAGGRRGRLWRKIKICYEEKDLEQIRQVVRWHVNLLTLHLGIVQAQQSPLSTDILPILQQIDQGVTALQVSDTSAKITQVEPSGISSRVIDSDDIESPISQQNALNESIARLMKLLERKPCVMESDDSQEILNDLERLLQFVQHDSLSVKMGGGDGDKTEDISNEVKLFTSLIVSAPFIKINQTDPMSSFDTKEPRVAIFQETKRKEMHTNDADLTVTTTKRREKFLFVSKNTSANQEEDDHLICASKPALIRPFYKPITTSDSLQYSI
ncbi:hypothetical protein ACLX1H_010249 [Fusarium chlamydosporum]